jgi:nicotinate-nucleotide--dimethylbenzimidazole phosphoribosyltransferase
MQLALINAAALRDPQLHPTPQVDPARIYTCAADHGVALSGVSRFPQEVTAQMMHNFLNGGAAINVLTRCSGVELMVVDAGVKGSDFPATPLLTRHKIRQGTANIRNGPAMSLTECTRAVELGIHLATQAAQDGVHTIGTGEMGIANSTTATALYCAYLGLAPDKITGPGTGLNEQGIRHKASVVTSALRANHVALNASDPLCILAAVGGLEIACLTGLILGGAWHKLAVVVDGFISTAAYVAAWKMHAAVKDYVFFGHGSAEPGHQVVLDHLSAQPILNLSMCLGEGTGAALAIFILRAAGAIYNNMSSFASAGIAGA